MQPAAACSSSIIVFVSGGQSLIHIQFNNKNLRFHILPQLLSWNFTHSFSLLNNMDAQNELNAHITYEVYPNFEFHPIIFAFFLEVLD